MSFNLPPSFRVQLKMTSDWHVGSGTGRPGNVDRLILRDEDGLPFVPAKTLTGIWRDACELAALDLDNGCEPALWSKWVEHLFGEQPARTMPGAHTPDPPRRAALSVRPARYPSELRPHLRGQSDKARAYQAALTFVQPGVKIDGATGRAKDDHLRFVEMVRGGTVLLANCELMVEDQYRPLASALLLAGTKLVSRLGGKRRRGAGLCTLEVLDVASNPFKLNTVADWLEKNLKASDVPKRANPDSRHIQPVVHNGEWLAVPIKIELLTPLAVTYRTVGNVMETLDFIPGTHLLSHVTRVLESLHVPARAAIARGDVCVLNATLEIDGDAGRPVPFAIETEKDGKGMKDPKSVRNMLFALNEKDDKQFKPLREGYLGPLVNNQMPCHETVEKSLRTHNTVDENKQRPTTEVGGVFSNEVISPRQHDAPTVFRTELRLRKDLLTSVSGKWWGKLNGECRLGRTKKDDYGLVRLTAEVDAAKGLLSLPAAKSITGATIDVWLLSDLLLRTDALRPRATVDVLEKALESRLKVTLAVGPAFVRTRRTESWNASWDLPRPSLLALQSGSCVRFQVTGTLDPKEVANIEAAGLGERTAEGFGQMSFNNEFLANTPSKLNPPCRPKKSTSAAAPLKKGEAGYEMARQLERIVWRESIRRSALAVAAGSKERKQLLQWTHNKPGMSQLGAFRDVAQSIQGKDATHAFAWVERVCGTKNRRDKWPDGGLDAIKNLLTFDKRAEVWKTLHNIKEVWTVLTEDGEVHLKEHLWSLAVRSLVDACIRAHKRELDKKRREKPPAPAAAGG